MLEGSGDAEQGLLAPQGRDTMLSGPSLSFVDVCYTVQVKGGQRKDILRGCTGRVEAGKLNALLGPTGAGKTSLMEVLMCRRRAQGQGHGQDEEGGAGLGLRGRVFVNGLPQRAATFKVGYVVQDDLLMADLTCRENIAFSANLRLPASRTAKQRAASVDDAIAKMRLTQCADTSVGNFFVRGLSGGERKRVNIAMELVTEPAVLFLDEPTSGLDSFTALSIVRQLKSLCESGCTVLATLHQPRSAIWTLFDNVLLIDAGAILFHGPATAVVPHFAKLGFQCEPFHNPGDFMLDVLCGVVDRQRLQGQDSEEDGQTDDQEREEHQHDEAQDEGRVHALLSEAWTTGDAHSQLTAALRAISPLAAAESTDSADSDAEAALSQELAFLAQFRILCAKHLLVLSRLPVVVVGQLVVMIFFSAVTGAIYFQCQLDKEGMQNRLGACFFLTMAMIFANLSALELFLKERALYIHQRRNRYFSTAAYYTSMLVCDLIPMRVVPMLFFASIVYPLMGFQHNWGNLGWFTLTLVLEAITSGALCYAVSALIGVFTVANLAISVVYVMTMVYGGLLVNISTLPWAMRWPQYFSFFRYGYETLVVTELHGLTFHDVVIPGVDVTGDDILKARGFSLDHRGPNLLAMTGLACAFILMGYAALAHISK